jgi:gas vesicle protein
MGRLKNFLKTVTIGGFVGFMVGLLFAPQKGDAARQKLQEAIEKGKEKFNEIKEGFKKGE